MKFNTKLLHGGTQPEELTGATNAPIFQSAAFRHATAEKLESIFNGAEPGYVYTRINNPTVDAFERRVALLEGGLGAVACASGMSAVTLAVLNLLRSGEEIVSGSGVFGGTYSLFGCLRDFGITTRYAGESKTESFVSCINENTRLLFVETIGNPKLDVPNIRELADLAHDHGIPLIVDNTMTTPYLFRPFEWGADIVVHSTSKYINGSGNSIGGMIIDSGKFKWNYEKFTSLREYAKYGRFVYQAKLRKTIFKDFGACMSPFNAYLTGTGLETLGIRMDRLCDNALQLAGLLNEQPKVQHVGYPGLVNHPEHEIAKRQFGGKYGALLTIRVGSKANAFKVINRLKYALNLANIGDAKTLVIHPASTIYAANSAEEKDSAGVYDDLIRISIGLEDIEDLAEDFLQALDGIN